MIPSCDHLPDAVRLEHDVAWSEFAPRLSKQGATRDGWILIMACRDCGQVWRVDQPDKLHVSIAFKVPSVDEAEWSDAADRSARIRYLERSWGGLSAHACAWLGCSQRALADVAMCAEHLYAQGTRARGA